MKQKKCADCLEVLLKIPTSSKSTLEPAVLRSLVSCLSELLLAQKTKSKLWNDGIVKKAFVYLLSMCTYENAKVRKHTQDELTRVMEHHSKEGFDATSKHVVAYLDNIVLLFDDKDYKDISFFLAFISKVILFIAPSQYDAIMTTLLTVPILPPLDL